MDISSHSVKDFIVFLKYFEFDITSSIILSIFGFLSFCGWKAYKKGFDSLDFGDSLPVALSVFSVFGGIRVMIYGLENTANHMDGTQQFYIVIGGGAVIWNGAKAIRKKVLDKSPAVDELLKFKKILDLGGITQAEYDQQKERLLKL